MVSHLEKVEYWERWRNAGRDAGMLLMCSDDTEEAAMVELEEKNGEMNTEIQKKKRRYARMNAPDDIP